MSLSPLSFSNYIFSSIDRLDQSESGRNIDVFNDLANHIDALSHPYICNCKPMSDSERYFYSSNFLEYKNNF